MKGEVIGITTAKYSGSTGSGASIEGIGFAIPIADVMSMTEDLIANGYRTNQAYLGVSVRDLPADTAAMYSLPTGSYILEVTEGSCAQAAGIQPKDIIIAVGEYPVEGNSTLQAALRKFKAGDTTTVTVFRGGQELQLPITFDERPQDPNADLQQPQQSGEMPSSGTYEDWYNYFYPFFGGRMP
jgi:serine protease Do